jgi:hypothetical protein
VVGQPGCTGRRREHESGNAEVWDFCVCESGDGPDHGDRQRGWSNRDGAGCFGGTSAPGLRLASGFSATAMRPAGENGLPIAGFGWGNGTRR